MKVKLMRKSFLILLVFKLLFSNSLSAQVISWADTPLSVSRISNGIYQREIPNGVVTNYEFAENGDILVSNKRLEGSFDTNKVAYYSMQEDGRIFFFDVSDNYIGYYCPKTKRFLDSKEYVLAILTDNGDLIDGNGGLYLKVNDIDERKEVIGFFVFFRY